MKKWTVIAAAVLSVYAYIFSVAATTTVKSYQPPKMVSEINTSLGEIDARIQSLLTTNGAGGAVTCTWATAYSVAPIVAVSYAESGGTDILYCVSTTTNVVITGTASKKINVIAVAK